MSDDSVEHPEKQPSPIEITEFGIVSDNNEEHPEKQ
jgi:hypothetical protein